ncbi:hypothetical protein [Stutzerimonas nitrititolerans]|uniref:hypothetical protein n=1 Tax=Stutzerimonas nitrititolerans TaxID=2482751 RepID=UPI0028AEE1A9|nr:hypothetical protein [Stutzerimonas nitrititolerans]
MHFYLEVTLDGKFSLNEKFGNYTASLEVINNLASGVIIQTKRDAQRIIFSRKPNEIEIDESCDRQVFIRMIKDFGAILSSNPELLFERGKANLNHNYFAQYIFCGPIPTTSTPFSDIYYLSPGSRVCLKKQTIRLGVTPPPRKSNFIAALDDLIERKTRDKKAVSIEFSGGLESSVLLHSVINSKYNGSLELIHATDSESGEADDLTRVRQLADLYNLNLTVIDQQDAIPFQIKKCASLRPNFPHSGLVNIDYIDILSEVALSDDALILNGCGGDSLFRSWPQSWLSLELIRSGKPLSALKWIYHLSDYTRSSFGLTIVDSLKDYKEIKLKISNPGLYFAKPTIASGILSKEYQPEEFICQLRDFAGAASMSVRERYIDALLNQHEMLSSPIASIPGCYYTPFLSDESISSSLAIPSTKLLKNKINRYELRKLAVDKYGAPSLWHTRKGSFTGLTQRCIQRNKRQIEEFILGGYFSRFLDTDRVRQEITAVAAGVRKCPSVILNLFTAGIFVHHWRGRVYDI